MSDGGSILDSWDSLLDEAPAPAEPTIIPEPVPTPAPTPPKRRTKKSQEDKTYEELFEERDSKTNDIPTVEEQIEKDVLPDVLLDLYDSEVIPKGLTKAVTQYRKVRHSKLSDKEKQHLTANVASLAYDMIFIKRGKIILGRKAPELVYHIIGERELSNISRDFYEGMWGAWTDTTLRSVAESIKSSIRKELEEVDNRYVQISDNYTWDAELGQFINPSEMSERPLVFRRLFDTKDSSKNVVKVPPLTEEDEQSLMEQYEIYLCELNDRDGHGVVGDYTPDLECIRTWADEVDEVAMDIMRAMAYCFIKNKPVGAYCLIGSRRNGKSTFVGLLNSLVGNSNTSNVRLSELGDPHFAHQLAGTFVNATDEEDESPTKYQAYFKTMADHGVLSLSTFYSQEPLKVSCDFMCFFPMNHIPEWTGSGAAACVSRTWAIPFFADLSRFDTSTKNFAQETFTKEFMIQLAAEVFALATYYTTHEPVKSKTMSLMQTSIEEEVDSAVVYKTKFEKYYDGFQNWNVVFDDYVLWCKQNDYKICPLKVFKFHWAQYRTGGRQKIYLGNKSFNVYLRKNRRPNYPVLSEYSKMNGYKLEEAHNNKWCFVSQMEADEEDAKTSGLLAKKENTDEPSR